MVAVDGEGAETDDLTASAASEPTTPQTPLEPKTPQVTSDHAATARPGNIDDDWLTGGGSDILGQLSSAHEPAEDKNGPAPSPGWSPIRRFNPSNGITPNGGITETVQKLSGRLQRGIPESDQKKSRDVNQTEGTLQKTSYKDRIRQGLERAAEQSSSSSEADQATKVLNAAKKQSPDDTVGRRLGRTAEAAGTAAAEKGIEALATATGVAAPVADRIGKALAPVVIERAKRKIRHAKRTIIVAAAAAAAFVLFLLGVLGVNLLQSTADSQQNAISNAAHDDIPGYYITAYQTAVANESVRIPWEILAGVGRVATDNGRYSPYDSTDRYTSGNSDYPEITPAVGDSKGGGGEGPMLLVQSQLTVPKDGTDYQNADSSIQLLADQIAAQAVSSLKHLHLPDDTLTATLDQPNAKLLWQDVLQHLPLAPGVGLDLTGAAGTLIAPTGQTGCSGTACNQIPATLVPILEAASAQECPTLPWQFTAAIADRESSFGTFGGASMNPSTGEVTPTIMNPSGATGPMQFMPSTFAEYATLAPNRPAGATPDINNMWDAIYSADNMLCKDGASTGNIEKAFLAYDDDPTEFQARWNIALSYGMNPTTPQTGNPTATTATPSTTTTVNTLTDTQTTTPPTSPGGPLPPGFTIDPSNPMQRFAIDVLANLNLPITVDNIETLQAWASGENSSAQFNPLDTTQPEPGATPFNYTPAGKPLVLNYPDYQTGLKATVDTLNQNGYGYPQIVAALKTGDNPQAVFAAIAASAWGTKRFPNPNFEASKNFPPGTWPTGTTPTVLTDLGTGGINGATSTVAVGPDSNYSQDAYTAAEVYAGVLPASDLKPAAIGSTAGGTTYIPISSQAGCNPAQYNLTVSGASTQAVQAVEEALSYCGIPYLWGGQRDGTTTGVEGPEGTIDPGMDCSGMVENAYWHAGITYLAHARVADAEWSATPTQVPISQALPGDLVVFGSHSASGGFHHIGIVLDPARHLMVDEPDTGSVDRIDNWDTFGDVYGVVARPAPAANPTVN